MSVSNRNRLIYKNTLFIYGRMLFVTFIGLFSSRFVLQALGASDYGLYNVVGGLISLFNILGTGMSTTTRRYINAEMGKPGGNLNKVFNVSLMLHIGFALLIFIIAETLGIWYINSILKVAEGKLCDAMFVFQVSTTIACLGIINIPYQSLIESYEQFGKSAIIDIVTTIIKFLLIIILLYYSGNALRFYAVCMCVVTLSSFIVYHIVCHKSWPLVIKHKFYRDFSLYKEMFIFNNYIALGAAASLGKTQGSNMIVNFFFGTVVNAAFSIAFQVQSYVYMFVNKLTLASYPQVTINYSSANMSRVNELVKRNSRICILIMTLLFFPLMAEIDFILNLWLRKVPEGAPLLCSLTLIQALLMSFSEGTNGMIQASGKIKWFQIIGSSLTLLNLPLSFFLFKLGYDAYWILVCFIIIGIVNRINSLYLMKRLLGFDVWRYIKEAYLSPLIVIAIMTLVVFLYCQINLSSVLEHIVGLLFVLLVTGTMSFVIGLNKEERWSVKSYFAAKLSKNN